MLAADDVRAAGFRRRLRGYRPAAVDRLLEDVAEECEALEADAAELRGRAGALEADVAEHRELERRMRDILVSAQRTIDRRQGAAQAESEAIVRDARARADELRAELDAERARVEGLIEGMRELERDLRASARAVVLEALRRLDGKPVETPRPAPPDVIATEPGTARAPEPPPAPREASSAPTEPPPAEQEPSLAAAPQVPVHREDTLAFPPVDEAEIGQPPAAAEPFGRRSLLLSLAILVVGAAVAIGIWQLASDEDSVPATAPASVSAPAASSAAEATVPGTTTVPEGEPAVESPAPAGPDQAAPVAARLTFRAIGGDSWLLVHAGSASGRLLFEGFLFEGESRRFSARRIWVRAGNPGNLIARLNGKRADLPAGTANLIATSEGLRTLRLD